MKIPQVLGRTFLALSTLAVGYQEQTKSQEVAPPIATNKVRDLPAFSIQERQISQLCERADSLPISRWVIAYTVQYNGDDPINPSACDINLKYEAWVANSSCPSHGIPKKSHAEFNLAQANPFLATVIDSSNDKRKCKENIFLGITKQIEDVDLPTLVRSAFLPINLKKGDRLKIFLICAHDHFLYGTYDPLLGEREIEITIAGNTIKDTISLNQELSPARTVVKLSTPPKERMDDRQFRSAPDSLYLAADVPGFQYFRFDDIKPIRRRTEFKLSFSYLIAVGTEGTCHARIMEYQDTPNAWYRLDGGFDQQLPLQGRWQKFEQTFRALDDATTIALDFRIVGANVGELWIDDLELVPVYDKNDRDKP